MNESQARAIIFLLFAILMVLLFGASAVLSGAAVVFWIVVGLAVLIFVFSVVLTIARTIFTTAPKALQAAPGFFRSFVRGWVKIITAPVAGPAGYWKEVQGLKAEGERVNPVALVAGLSYRFFVGLVMSYITITLTALLIYSAGKAALEHI